MFNTSLESNELIQIHLNHWGGNTKIKAKNAERDKEKIAAFFFFLLIHSGQHRDISQLQTLGLV